MPLRFHLHATAVANDVETAVLSTGTHNCNSLFFLFETITHLGLKAAFTPVPQGVLLIVEQSIGHAGELAFKAKQGIHDGVMGCGVAVEIHGPP